MALCPGNGGCPITGIGATALFSRHQSSESKDSNRGLSVFSGAVVPPSELVNLLEFLSRSTVTKAACFGPPPAQWGYALGNSPLKLIICRTWHDFYSYTDTLECGHESRHYSDFEWQDGRLVNLQPTAKRRRCKKCAKEAHATTVNVRANQFLSASGTRSHPAHAGLENEQPLANRNGRLDTLSGSEETHPEISTGCARGLSGLYADCLTETSTPSPKKPCATERNPKRGKKAA
jgi:hypothetical protein